MTTTTKAKPVTSLLDEAFPTSDAEAIKQYAALVTRHDKPRPGDAKQLKELMVQLKKTPDDVKRDIGIIQEVREKERPEAQARIDEITELMKPLGIEMEGWTKETMRIEEERQKRFSDIQMQSTRLGYEKQHIVEKHNEARELRHHHPDLFPDGVD